MNEENKHIEAQEKSSIDYGKVFRDIKKHRKLYFLVLAITFVVAAIVALSIPSSYTCQVKLSPELSTRRSNNSLASLASSFGVNLGNSAAGSEALFPTLYPDLMNSVDFKTALFPVKVTIEGDPRKGTQDRTMTYYDYLKNEQKEPWWDAVFSLPGKLIKWVVMLFMDEEMEKPTKAVNPFRLTKQQARVLKAIDDKVICDVDNKTMVITINVTDQNPLICATMADTVKTRLQKFITEYRTNKARVDLAYYRKIEVETKERYEQARIRYAGFSDANRDAQSQRSITRRAELMNEMTLQQGIYQQVVQQLQQAELKVQEETPAFTTLQSATVPLKRSAPSRAKICIIWLFLAFLGTTVWVLYKEGDLKSLLGLS